MVTWYSYGCCSITGRMTVTTLEPVGRLILLRSLLCQSTGVTSLAPLSGLTELRELNASNTKVSDLKPLAGKSAATNVAAISTKNTPAAAMPASLRRGEGACSRSSVDDVSITANASSTTMPPT